MGDTPLRYHLVQGGNGETGVLSRLFYGHQFVFPDDLTHASLLPPPVLVCPEIGLNWPPTGPPLAPKVAGPCPGVLPVDCAASSIERNLCIPLNCRILL